MYELSIKIEKGLLDIKIGYIGEAMVCYKNRKTVKKYNHSVKNSSLSSSVSKICLCWEDLP